jgi:RHS repeat-associated protein
VQYLHPDHLGSIGSDAHAHQSITSQTGDWVQDVYYYPYGGIRWSRDGGTTPSPASATRRTYTGQYDIGFWAGSIQHYNARQHDYVLGRFLQPDVLVPAPGNPQTLNRYSYAINDPVNHRDPSGHCFTGTIDTALCLIAFVGIALIFSQVPSESPALVANGVMPAGDGGVMALGALMVAPHIIVSAGANACAANPSACAAQAQQAVTQANNACGGDLCASEVQQACGGDCSDEVATSATGINITSQSIEYATRLSTQNGQSNNVVIGWFRGGNGYTAMAERLGARYLDMPTNMWQRFQNDPAAFRLVNERFLQNAIRDGATFTLETTYAEAMTRTDSNYWWEITYLLGNGYQLVIQNGQQMLVPK